jgi:hypothetical protein
MISVREDDGQRRCSEGGLIIGGGYEVRDLV